MNKEDLILRLQSMNACEQGINYLKSQKSLKTAWDNCRPPYLWWLIRRTVGVTPTQSVEFAKVSAAYAEFVAKRTAEWAAEQRGIMTPRQYINAHWTRSQIVKEMEK